MVKKWLFACIFYLPGVFVRGSIIGGMKNTIGMV